MRLRALRRPRPSPEPSGLDGLLTPGVPCSGTRSGGCVRRKAEPADLSQGAPFNQVTAFGPVVVLAGPQGREKKVESPESGGLEVAAQ